MKAGINLEDGKDVMEKINKDYYSLVQEPVSAV